MNRKIFTSVSIFAILFTSAWVLDSKGKREFFNPDEYVSNSNEFDDVIPLNNQLVNLGNIENVNEVERLNKVERFKSREYVRIESQI